MAAFKGLVRTGRRWAVTRRGRAPLGRIIERLEQRSMLSGIQQDFDAGGSALGSSTPLGESSEISTLNTNRPPSLLPAAFPSLVPVAAAVVLPTNGSTSGSTLVSALVDAGGALGNFADPDFDLPGIAVVGLNLQGGRLWFSVNNGTSWREITQASPASATLLHADNLTRLFFSPAVGFQGTLSDVLTFRAWDRTGGHANGASGINTQHLFAAAGATLATGSTSETVAVSRDGRYAVVADHSAGLVIVDVGNPLRPVKVGAYKGTGEFRGVAISEDGRYAYFATGSTGLQVIDISTPSNPVRVGGFNTAGFATFVTLSKDGRYAYVADGDAGLRILDISNPQSPRNVGGVGTVDWARGVAVSADGRYAYVSDWTAGMKVIDIRNPAQPVQVAAFGTAGYADGVAMLPGDRYVLVAAHTAGLQIVDVSNPAAPVAAGRSDTLYAARRVAVSSDGRAAFVADSRGGVTLVDVRTPSSPVPLSHVATLGSAESVAVSADGRHLFVAIAAGGLQTIAVSADPSPFSRASDAVGVDVGPTNAAPSGITLAAAPIRENTPVAARVGTLAASDPDYGDTFAFTLVSGDGSVDNASFEIVGNEVRSAASFNFEAQRHYSIRVRATDQGGLFTEKSFAISIADANDAPVLSPEASPSLVPVLVAVTSPANGSISGSTLVSELVDTGGQHSNFRDADGNLPGIAIVGLNLQGGKLWFSVNGGSSWSEITRAAMAQATLLHADNLTRLFFSPAPGFQGSLSDVITFRAWDRTGGHLNGAIGVNTQPLLGPEAGVLATGAWADLVVTSRDGRYAFMVDGSSKLTIVDISNPASPVEVGWYSGLGEFRSVAVAANGRFAFLANGHTGLEVLDVADPSRPVKVAAAKTLGFATNVTLSPDERFAFVADGHAGLRIVDISVPTAPRLLGGADTSDWARSVVVSPDAFYAYVADWTAGLKIFDVRDPDRPTLVASFGTAGYVDGLVLAADGRHLFAAVHSAGLQVIDVTNPAAPISVGRTVTFDAAQRVTLSTDGRYALVADQRAGLTAIDVRTPSAPSRLGSFETPGIASGVAVTPNGRHVFVADGAGSLRAVPISVEANAFSASSDVASVAIGSPNARPTDVALARGTVAENQPLGTSVGALTTTDPDTNDTFTYTLVSGAGANDNASFVIVGNEVRSAAAFDYEKKHSYSIRVRSTDAGGLFTEKVFVISVTDMPNAVGGTHVVDGKANPLFADVAVRTYLSGEPGLHPDLVADLNTPATRPIPLDIDGVEEIKVTALGFWSHMGSGETGGAGRQGHLVSTGSSYESFRIAGLSNAPINALVGVFSDNTAVSNRGQRPQRIDHAAGFVVAPALNQMFFVGADAGRIRVPAGATKLYLGLHDAHTWNDNIGQLSVTITLPGQATTDIALSATSIVENQPIGTKIGTLSTADPDSGDTFTYTLVSGSGSTDNASFVIVGNELRTAVSFDYEAKASFSIRVRSTDKNGLFVEKPLTVSVTDVDDALIESVGEVALRQGPNGRLLANNEVVTLGGRPVDYHSMTSLGWRAVAAEAIAGANTLVWRHSSGHLHFWRLSGSWAHVTSEGWQAAGSPDHSATELAFGMDFNGDAVIGVPLTTLEAVGLVALKHDAAGNLYAGNSVITLGGLPVNYQSMNTAGWRAVAAEAIAGANTLVWRHSSGHLHFWRLSGSWAHVTSEGWQKPRSAEARASELVFDMDLNENGTVGL